MVTEEEVKKYKDEPGLGKMIYQVSYKLLKIEKFIRTNEGKIMNRRKRLHKEMTVDGKGLSSVMGNIDLASPDLLSNPLGMIHMMTKKMEDMTRERNERSEQELKEDEDYLYDKVEITDKEVAEFLSDVSDAKGVDSATTVSDKPPGKVAVGAGDG